MARRTRWLEIKRNRHGAIWWILIGWWERPIASISWYILAEISGCKGVKYIYPQKVKR